MRKSELAVIKIREYERGLTDAYKKFEVTEEFIEEWMDIILNHTGGPGEDKRLFMAMLTEIGCKIIKDGEK